MRRAKPKWLAQSHNDGIGDALGFGTLHASHPGRPGVGLGIAGLV